MTPRAIALLCLWVARAGAAPDAAAPHGEVVRIEHRDPSATPSRGPATALVTIELFLAPTTGSQNRVQSYKYLEDLQARHPTRVRLVYRVLKVADPTLPAASLEAQAQGKFFEFMTAVSTRRERLTRDSVIALGEKLGMDAGRLASAIRTDRYKDVLAENRRRFDRLHGGNVPNALFNSQAPHGTLSALSPADLEAAYVAAKDSALEKLDRGIDPRDLPAAFDADVLSGAKPVVVQTAASEDDDSAREPPLATPPLRLHGMPSSGRDGATVPITLLCSATNPGCGNLMLAAQHIAELYPDDVRVVWAPWFDVTRDDAAELALLADATLCAELVGTSSIPQVSPGWRWVEETYRQITRNHQKVLADERIDAVATALEVDRARLATCQARLAGTAVEWITAARHAGVRDSPAVVIGGRIYAHLGEQATIQQLVEAELAPGVLGSWPSWPSAR